MIKQIKDTKPIRVTPEQVYLKTEEQTEQFISVAGAVFPLELVTTVATLIKEKNNLKKGRLELIPLETASQKAAVAITFEKHQGSKSLQLTLEGDWGERQDRLTLGEALRAPASAAIYLKHTPQDEESIAKIGKRLQPNDAIFFAMQGKSHKWYIRLPKEEFPDGGILTEVTVTNGQLVEEGDIVCYVRKM